MKTREEAVNEIINGTMLIGADHPYKNDILFFNMLKNAAAEKEWYEVADFCVIQIQHIENKQRLDMMKGDLYSYNKNLNKLRQTIINSNLPNTRPQEKP